MADVLLATKLHIPPPRRSLVDRPHLVVRLDQAFQQNHRLNIVSAPAGYGKSTLLSEWVRKGKYPAGWLSLDKGDNAPPRFWRYFISALQSIPELHQAEVGTTVLQSLQTEQKPSIDVLLTDLLNDISRLNERVVLVLDDLHLINDSQIHQQLVFLIENLPQDHIGLHLVIASRRDPPWPLARWRVRDELTELRTKDLRFTPQEAAAFLNQVMELNLAATDITILEQRTEGWIAGLQMAALSMQGRSDIAGFLTGFSGSHHFVLDYLIEEVLSTQKPEILKFLLQTSILEYLTASLCDAVTGTQDSHQVLNQLDSSNMFLVALDEERRWYRYHHLFADLLHKRLTQTQPELIDELHLRASKWYAQNNFITQAIDHALDAGDVAQVNEFISGNALALVEQTELMDVLRHFEQMSEEEMCAKPWLCVAYAWVKAYVDPSGGMDQILLNALESVNGVEDVVERQHLLSQLDAVWAYVAWVKGKAELALEFARTAFENLPEDDWKTRAHLLNIQGLAWQYLDDLPAANQSFEAAIVAGQRTGRPFESFHAYTNWAYAEILQGHLQQAYSLCQHVLILAEQSGLYAKGLPVLAYAYATMSMVQREWNHLESAVAFARQSVALAERWRQADTLHFALTCLTEALCAAGDLEAAFAANQRAMQLALDVSPWFVEISASEAVMLSLAKGDLGAASRQFAELEATLDREDKKGQYSFARVALYNALGRNSDVLESIDLVIDDLEQKGKVWFLLKLLPLQALALQALDRQEEALDVIGRCLPLAAKEGFVRIFIERGAPMAKLLRLASRRGIELEYINKLLPVFDASIFTDEQVVSEPRLAQSDKLKVGLLESLSERELQVLRLLDSPLTGEEIGRELYISTNTVRTHIKNIYAKLGVNRRVEAVHRAKDIDLL